MSLARFLVRLAPPQEGQPRAIRVDIGGIWRDFSPEQARGVADRLHDLADRLEQPGGNP